MPFTFNAGEYPELPGCYLMRNAEGDILYVGKSKSLRNRLRSYFTKNHELKRIRQLVGEIASIEVVLVNNEAESLLLENNLIKLHKPPYNRALKRDDTGYAYLRLTAERYPRLELYFRGSGEQHADADPDGLPRLGPIKDSGYRDTLFAFISDHYGLRTCETMPKKVCLLYHIGRCCGICEGKVTDAEYAERARAAARLLANKGEGLIEALYRQMEDYAARLEFERAQKLLVGIRSLEQAAGKQIVEREADIDQDVLYFGEDHVMIAEVREGMLRDFRLEALDRTTEEAACDLFLIERYAGERPDELIVNAVADPNSVRAALRRRGDKPLTITQPKRGVKRELLQLCKTNYEYRLDRLRGEGRTGGQA
ncbi:GIY-YIG nuclease family protein [Paenibacillus arenilitoris]|uniref:GIY-YIG nuclease family protein n=1 Tax=Paenibacillus arenilitoris TaxID=2772299 RepID=A0A927H693_9BACL|nr:GIY-YIG nuclease family protein [Paenibacillus arenilitoris]MBD2869267.1 GIY-YIG nuclease family protein [Paenibacillus arenilitoris]